jgi:xanthine dehydrogenase YagR molybdenum-binding subunit
VQAACARLRDALIARAIGDTASSLDGAAAADVAIEAGDLFVRAQPRRRETIAALAGRIAGALDTIAEAKPGDEKDRYALHSFGAVFAEVHVDPELGVIRVPRIVATCDVGRRLNAKTALSQLQGGIGWGVSFALLEHAILDERDGRIVNANLAEYHVPVNADIQTIDVTFVDHPGLRVQSPRHSRHRRDRHNRRAGCAGERDPSRNRPAHSRSADHARQAALAARPVAPLRAGMGVA